MQKTITKVVYDKRIKPFKIKTQRQINSFLKRTDFNKMQQMFEKMGWVWIDEDKPYTPTSEQIKEFVIKMINDANTGQFEIHYCGRIMIINVAWGFELHIGYLNP